MSQHDLPHARPTSSGLLTGARIASVVASVTGGAAVAAGILPNAWVEGGLNLLVAVAVPVAVTVLLGVLWHGTLGYAAHAQSAGERGLAAVFGSGLFSIGVLISAWFLAAILSGQMALHGYQREYLDRLDAARTHVAENVAREQNIVAAVIGTGANLQALAAAEGKIGMVSGRTGCKAVCETLMAFSASVGRKGTALTKVQDDRSDKLDKAREAIGAARRAVAANDKSGFEDNVATAVELISAASAIDVRVTDLGLGLDLSRVQEQVAPTIQSISAVVDDAGRKRRVVKVPLYEPIDTRTAILLRPQPLAWLAAGAIEGLPFLLLCLLMAVWRAPPADAMTQSDSVTRRAGIRLVPGE